MDLAGKNVVVVGGFGGIGFEVCKHLALKNVQHLLILDKTLNTDAFSQLQAISAAVQCHFIAYDTTKSAPEIKRIFANIVAKIKHIDVLVNLAAICDEHEVELTISVNLTGLINTTNAALELMDARKTDGGRGGGLIVNTGSVVGLDPVSVLPTYCATKAAVIAYTRALSQLQPLTGVTLFTLCPGVTKTPILDMKNTFMDFEPDFGRKVQRVPMQTAEECSRNVIKTIEECKNGAVWMLDLGNVELLEIKNYWQAPKELS